ncbi:MAG TPA: uroporphyrinogen-III synthase [Candidatus Saccharimonadia bacterium]|nr:uroporphyrinogen-III synthase [Candidatus Saccharimonadia bacterium]
MATASLTVLTRDQAGNQIWRDQLTACGISSYSLDCIIRSVAKVTPELTTIFRSLATCDWVIFTSAAGVTYFRQLCAALNVSTKSLDSLRIATVGNETANAAKKLGIQAAFIPVVQNAQTLARDLPDVAGRRVVLMRSDIAFQDPIDILRERAAIVTNVAVYRTSSVTSPDPEFSKLMQQEKIGCIVFASPSAVTGFFCRIQERTVVSRALSLPVVASGPTTAASLTQHGFRKIRIAAHPTLTAIRSLLS